MEPVRIIHATNYENAMDERVVFTQEDTPAQDFFGPAYEINSETNHMMNIPSGFPMEHALVVSEIL